MPVDQLHPPPGEALEGIGLRRIDDVLDDAGDQEGRLARPAKPAILIKQTGKLRAVPESA